jgi:DNA-binding transcriptional LysR family regulator
MSWEQRVGNRVKLRELQVLMEVAKAGSMGKAAERLHVSQPVVSKAIANLEHALGARLLDRNVQGVQLTDFGHAALKCGIAVFDDIKKGIEEIQFIANPAVGTVRVGCPDPEFIGLVSDVIERLAARHPRLQFHIVRPDTAAMFRELDARDVDLVLYTLSDPVNDEHLDVEFLYSEPIVVAVGSSSPWARRRRVKLAELAEEAWLLPAPPGFVTTVIDNAFRECGLGTPRPAVVCSAINRLALAANGRFVTAAPRAMLQSTGKRMPIKALAIDLPGQQRPVSIVTLKGRSLSPAARLFIECAREVAKSLARRPRSARPGRGRARANSSRRRSS